jgi:signal transduction histidine kinase
VPLNLIVSRDQQSSCGPTKPTGTGLGLSITYDIVTTQHGGTITVDSEVDAFTEFVITLPRQMFTTGGSRA